ncbi:aldehyde dehydrogenase family protein [Actinokineospora xionganensis]|uniref:Aldehyde dehydrogenase family protein n=1 Tax=Actinokineospora xionganensis TaxID=2684470 RepID=A0ABR7KZR3_9PSEU|nr:aldehyde dehydrogenase family protein [Actinokineospora xionganensis]MBC6445654.1 aldehyde dehydrogenase family protein [Actinokineospora xionganensis]
MTRVVSTSPQRPSDVVADVSVTEPGAVLAAAAQARAAQREWSSAAPGVRAAALSAVAQAVADNAAELAALAVREVGKPAAEAAGEVARTIALLRYYAQQAFDPIGETYPTGAGLGFTARRPRGVAGLITAWNFPLAIPVWKSAPALAFGNAVLIKPSPDATACALRLGELFAAHLPAGLFSVLPGAAATGAALVSCVDAVSFTGSGAVGRGIAIDAARQGIPAQCEMGGLSATIVLPDADLDRAATDIAYAAMGFAGQKCTATKRVIVVGDSGPLGEALASRIGDLGFGDPADPKVVVGPVISEQARDRVADAVAHARADGGQVVACGTRAGDDGWFVGPTVIAGLAPDAVLNHEEVFGPIATLTSVLDLDAALAMANGTDYGLVTAIYTADLDVALAAADRCESGMVKVNAPTAGVDFHLPFGGEKDSGYGGREQGKAAAAFYTSSRTVQIGANR